MQSTPAKSFLLSTRLLPTVIAIVVLIGSVAVAQTQAKPESSIIAPLAPKSLLLDAARAGNTFVAVGERGHVVLSSDGGNTWRQAQIPTRALLTAVTFADAKNGWAVGHDSVILHTGDGGSTWTLQRSAPEEETPYLDVWFADAKRGFAIGAYGACSKTDDGGATWVDHPVSDEDFHLNQIARSSNGKLYIAAEAGNVFRSDDDGETWTPLTLPYDGSFFGVLPLEGDTVLVFGLRGHLLRSEDAGATWRAIETGTLSMLNGGTQLADGRIVIGGLGGVLLVSSDGGRTFQLKQQSTRAGIQTVVAAGNTLLLAGEAGVKMLPLSGLAK